MLVYLFTMEHSVNAAVCGSFLYIAIDNIIVWRVLEFLIIVYIFVLDVVVQFIFSNEDSAVAYTRASRIQWNAGVFRLYPHRGNGCET